MAQAPNASAGEAEMKGHLASQPRDSTVPRLEGILVSKRKWMVLEEPHLSSDFCAHMPTLTQAHTHTHTHS